MAILHTLYIEPAWGRLIAPALAVPLRREGEVSEELASAAAASPIDAQRCSYTICSTPTGRSVGKLGGILRWTENQASLPQKEAK